MTTMRQLRKAAMSLPDAVEVRRGRGVTFSVADVDFVTCVDGTLRLLLPASRVQEVVERHPETRAIDAANLETGIEVALTDINGMVLNALVRASWQRCAPPATAKQLQHHENHAGESLPSGLSKPALRALGGAGLHTLDEVAAFGRPALEALHGVGPRAVRILEEALHAEGKHLR